MSTMAPPNLNPLRGRLAALRRRRAVAAWGAGLTGWALTLLGILAAIFVLDWLFALDRLQRALVLLPALAGAYWSFRRLVWPLFTRHEDEIETALIVERQLGIDSDLVAALQFDDPKSADNGSPELRRAVVQYVAAGANDLDVFAGFTWNPLPKRAALLAGAGTAVLLAALLAPGWLETFLARLAFGADHYPTATRILHITVNGKKIELVRHRPRPEEAVVRVPYGLNVAIEVEAGGTIPATGAVRLQSLATRQETVMNLASGPASPQTFRGELPRFMEDLTLRAELGDAWTDPLTLAIIPPPTIDVKLLPDVPEYARKAMSPDDAPPGARSISVVEGAAVGLEVTASKPLASATVTIDDVPFPLTAADAEGIVWKLSQPNTPLARVIQPLRYEVQVVDRDALSLDQPIQGFVRIKADRPPRCTAAMITLFVMPTAKPKLSYGAADDFGIAKLVLIREVVRAGENSGNGEPAEVNRLQDETASAESAAATPAAATSPAGAADDGSIPAVPPVPEAARQAERTSVELPLKPGLNPVVQGELPLPLAELKLKRGDQVRLTLEATDFRGTAEGVTASSEPLVLQVTDERGVLAAMAETDERSAKSLDAIIQRQLGIGEGK